MKRVNKRRLWPVLTAALLLVLSLCCLGQYRHVSRLLPSQQAAARWRGDNEIPFAQISCFMPVGGSVSEEQIYSFRSAMAAKLTEAGFEVTADSTLMRDAWCAFGKANISRGQRRAEVGVTAVGGSFFDIHSLSLVSGNYLRDDDLMEDRVLLDRHCAWLLFGSDNIVGMDFEINGMPFYVAGVIEREQDRFSREARGEDMGIYMSWEGWKKLSENAAIGCYELVMAEPVEGFVYRAATEKFPIASGEIVDNSYRFQPERILKMLKNGAQRSMRLSEASYPYWENAARAAEDRCLLWLTAGLVLALMPALLLIWLIISVIRRGKAKLEDEYIPQTREKISEAWRIRARRRWKKKNPNMK